MVMGRRPTTTTLERDGTTPLAKNQNQGTSPLGRGQRQAWKKVPVQDETPTTPKYHQRLSDDDNSDSDRQDHPTEAGERAPPAPNTNTIITAAPTPPIVQSGAVTEIEASLDGGSGGGIKNTAGAAMAAAADNAPASASAAAVPALGVRPISVQGKASSSSPWPPPRSLLLRERAARTWWRGLTCGVCFAAGAWAREGHAVFGAALAMAAVCGEMVLHELNCPPS